MARASRAQIAEALSQADPSIGRLLEIIGAPPARSTLKVEDRFALLARAILHQQLATKAAATISGRVTDALGGRITAAGLLAVEPGILRSCGVSGAKEAALGDLASRVSDGRLDLAGFARHSDHEVIADLVAVRGIGQWTAEMFLMGPLGRHDIWPVGDLGVRNGWALIRRQSVANPRDLLDAADHLRPYRSSVAWACWRAVDVAREGDGSLPR